MIVKAVVFDIDGTIVTFNLDYMAARAEVIGFLSTQGFPRSIFSLNESVFEMLNKVEVSVKNQHKNKAEFFKLKREALDILQKYEMQSATSTGLVPGIMETLHALKESKLKLGLFTTNAKRSTDYILDTYRLRPFFDAVVTRDSVSHVKPNPLHLEAVLKALKAKPEETIVVGDSLWDIKSAKELGVFSVGAISGVAKPEELVNAGADCLISSPTDLISLIEELKKQDASEEKKQTIA